MKHLAVLISNAGTGTNLQAIIDGVEEKKINGKMVVVVSDTEDAYGLVRAKKHGIETYILKKGEKLEDILQHYRVDFVCLAGWKKIVTDQMIETFTDRILNLHPGVIPDTFEGMSKNPDGTPGLWNRGKFTDAAIQNFLDNHVTYAGSSIHFLSKQFDFGKVLDRCFEKIQEHDTVESLYNRLKVKENELYVSVLQKLCA